MKKMRKGFTLVELLIVIAIVGILGVMGLISGSEATDAAKATRIVDEFNKISAAMMMYYADNYTSADANDLTADNLLAGAKAYLKKADADALLVSDDTKLAVGKYAIELGQEDSGTPKTWWIGTQLDMNSRVPDILANRANRLGLKTATKDGATYTVSTSNTKVYMKVR